MINWTDINEEEKSAALQRLLEIGAIRLLLAGMYFLFGRITAKPEPGRVYAVPARPVSRALRHQRLRDARLSRDDNRSLAPFRKFMPPGLTHNQFLERCTKLSKMGRFQIYDFLYYRWEFWRIGAIAKRCRSTLPASGIVGSLQPFGLSAAHLGPD